MAVGLQTLEQSIRKSLEGAVTDLRAILGFDSGAELRVGAFEVLPDATALTEMDRLFEIVTNIWVDFDGDSNGRIVLVLDGKSADSLIAELSANAGGFQNDEDKWRDTLGEIGNVVLNEVVKGFIRDFGLELRASLPEVRDTALYQVCAEAIGNTQSSAALIMDSLIRIDAVGLQAEVWIVLDSVQFGV